MSLEETYNKIRQFCNQNGLSNLKGPDMTLDGLIEDSKRANDLTPDLLEELMVSMNAYCAYIRSQKSSVASQLGIIKSEYNKLLHIKSAVISQQGLYYTKEERLSVVLHENPDIESMRLEVLGLQAELDNIKDIPYVLDNTQDILKIVYRKKIDEIKGRA